MPKIDIAGLKIDALTKLQLLDELAKRVKNGQKTFLTTPYSEFLFYGLRDAKIMETLNRADLAIADGIGIFWAKRFLDLPLTAKKYWPKILQAAGQLTYSLAAIIFYPKWIKSALPEKVVGANLIWDLAKLAAKNHWSIYLLGGFGDTSKIAADELKNYCLQTYGLQLTTYNSNKNPGDPSAIGDIKKVNPDFLFIAYGPVAQEKWITQHLPDLPIKLAIGLGGTFDYLAQKKLNPPQFLRITGFEWLWRLITQPFRIKRIFNATFGLIWYLLHYKVFMGYPIRKNAVAVIFNKEKKIFVARKSPKFHSIDIINDHFLQKWQNYWQFPQGGIEDTEDVITAVKREILEETGMDNLEFLKVSAQTHTYIWNNALRRFWRNRDYCFKGQTQNVIYLKFTGNDTSIALPPNEEFIDYNWVPIEELPNAVHEERLPVVKIIQEDLLEMQQKGII